MKCNACLVLAGLAFSVTACYNANLPPDAPAEGVMVETIEPAESPGDTWLSLPEPALPTEATGTSKATDTAEPTATTGTEKPGASAGNTRAESTGDGVFQALPAEEAPRLIWERIAENASFSQLYSHPKVVRYRHNYLKRQKMLDIMSRRAEPFIHFIVTEIERRNMPGELAILPMVESGYHPKALSRARAAGLWQFIPRTAREYDLARTCCYDARYDVHASTMAALDHLADLHEEFEGDWILALMAYNAGVNRVRGALKRDTGKGSPGRYWNLRLPRETREYVPRLLALSSIVHDPDLRTTLLHPVANAQHVEILEIDKRISPAKLFNSEGIVHDEIQALNPAVRHLDYPLPAGHRLLVPPHRAEQIISVIEQLPAEEAPNLYTHVIRYGESLSVIARRYGTSVSTLKKVNRLTGTTIRAGKKLMIPANARFPARPHRHTIAYGESLSIIARRYGTSVSALKRTNRLQGVTIQAGKTLLIPYSTGYRAPSPAENVLVRHRHAIAPGESLSVIAQRYGTSVSALKKVNRLNSTTIRAGKILLIPANTRIPARPHRHVIAHGESLSVIARRYGTSVSALKRANRLTGTTIQAGKTLMIPGRAETRNPPPDGSPAQQYRHTVARGESLSIIAQRYGTSVSALKKVNRLKSTLIHTGSTLTIPF
ncbi:MAG: LysM peptidoglycan-binding domain-containing protein [Gammaproteobacteria bacterium]|nr:LysM peptidoglycan-binding domain-containing protein [Gammaproteobacteria bacterium]